MSATCSSSLNIVARRAMLERVDPAFSGADAYGLLHRGHEDLAVADLARESGLDDGIDGGIAHGGRQDDRDPDRRKKTDHVFGAAIQLGMAFLPPKAFDLGDGQAIDADIGKRLAHFVELERLDDGRY